MRQQSAGKKINKSRCKTTSLSWRNTTVEEDGQQQQFRSISYYFTCFPLMYYSGKSFFFFF
jgi:hypothetical protein